MWRSVISRGSPVGRQIAQKAKGSFTSTRPLLQSTQPQIRHYHPLVHNQPATHSLAAITSASRGAKFPKIAMAPAAKLSSSTLPAGYKEDTTKGAMLRFQDSLPRLPVPALAETAAKYLKSVHPLLTPQEFQATKAAVEEFVRPGGKGEELQKRLVAKAERPEVKNWIIDWWNYNAYLGYRDPVVPYVSYFYSYRDDKKRKNPAKRAAAITTAALEFKQQTDEGTLEPDYMRKAPICMDSFQYMWNCCRIPAKGADYPKIYDYREHKYFIAARKNQFFKIYHEIDGKQLNTSELEAQFNRVYEMANAEKVPAIGALTSENRDVWTEAREVLLNAHPSNKAALETVEASSFLVCLDDTGPVTLEERAHQYWHGDGQNRWYDKPMQFIVNDNGTAGFMGEHSMMDGTPTHRVSDYVNDQIVNNKLDFGGSVRSNLPEPQLVRFHVNDAVAKEIDRARVDFESVIGEHELCVQQYQGYGKGMIKKFKCSPDAYVQMVIQLAYRKMYGKNRPTYESAATRKFQQGRTETCRTVSDESVAWCEAMVDPDTDEKSTIQLFRKAVNAHVKYIAEASDGKGCDRHLFGLKQLLEPGEDVPAIYKDPAYSYSSSWYLSTSQLSSEYFNGYGWSQVIDGGFGIAYMINKNNIQFNIVSKKLGSARMSFWLRDAADDMRTLLETELSAPAPKL